MMKKNYIVPQMEVMEIKQSVSILAGSGIDGVSSGGVLDPVIGPGTGGGRAPEMDDFEEMQKLLFE